jgi:hypothetical protein|tara:strand:+ start:314 stop:697 length:384 start_codon:yes stop_codon:yes gene_type:complete
MSEATVETLMNDPAVISDLNNLAAEHQKSGFVGFVGLATDDHPCTLTLKFESMVIDGKDDFLLHAYYESESTDLDEESNFLANLADRLAEDLLPLRENWSEKSIESYGAGIYTVFLFHNGKQIYGSV